MCQNFWKTKKYATNPFHGIGWCRLPQLAKRNRGIVLSRTWRRLRKHVVARCTEELSQINYTKTNPFRGVDWCRLRQQLCRNVRLMYYVVHDERGGASVATRCTNIRHETKKRPSIGANPNQRTLVDAAKPYTPGPCPAKYSRRCRS